METQDETPLPPAPPEPKRRPPGIVTLSDVKRRMAKVLNALEKASKDPDAAGAMSVDHARTLIYGYSKLAELMKDMTADELLRRMEQLEQRQAQAEGQAGAH